MTGGLLHDLSQPSRSETARRNTNLFTGSVRADAAALPFAEHLVHRTTKGVLVRSKSELVIANHLESIGLDYHYERPLEGEGTGGRRWPDFTFVDDAGDVVVWEHLGMLDRPGLPGRLGAEEGVVRGQRLRRGDRPVHDGRRGRRTGLRADRAGRGAGARGAELMRRSAAMIRGTDRRQ